MAMNDTIISWNITNWVTIVLMALTFFVLVGVVEKIVLRAQQNQGA